MTRVSIASADPNDADARALITELGAELTRVTGHFTSWSYSPADALMPRSVFVVARDEDNQGRAVGCGAIRQLDGAHTDIAELKRMYARRGTCGVGHAILTHLEKTARQFGYRQIWLETGVENERAIRFYQRHGYSAIPNFGPYEGHAEATCLGKDLDSH